MNVILPLGRNFALCVVSVALLLSAPGCSKKPSGEADATAATNRASDEGRLTSLDAGQKVCFGCDGKGVAPCRAAGCAAGQMECPGSCLRLSRGRWEHMEVAGHGPTEVWQKFPNGPGQWTFWNQHH